MTHSDELLARNAAFADGFDPGPLPTGASRLIPHTGKLRGFGYELETGRLREVT
jgi:hypothetical protein